MSILTTNLAALSSDKWNRTCPCLYPLSRRRRWSRARLLCRQTTLMLLEKDRSTRSRRWFLTPKSIRTDVIFMHEPPSWLECREATSDDRVTQQGVPSATATRASGSAGIAEIAIATADLGSDAGAAAFQLQVALLPGSFQGASDMPGGQPGRYQLPAELGVRECAFFTQTRSLRRQMYV